MSEAYGRDHITKSSTVPPQSGSDRITGSLHSKHHPVLLSSDSGVPPFHHKPALLKAVKVPAYQQQTNSSNRQRTQPWENKKSKTMEAPPPKQLYSKKEVAKDLTPAQKEYREQFKNQLAFAENRYNIPLQAFCPRISQEEKEGQTGMLLKRLQNKEQDSVR